METAIVSILFFAASLVCTIASIVISFHTEIQWSIALGAIAMILAIAGLLFTLRDMKHKTGKDDDPET